MDEKMDNQNQPNNNESKENTIQHKGNQMY